LRRSSGPGPAASPSPDPRAVAALARILRCDFHRVRAEWLATGDSAQVISDFSQVIWISVPNNLMKCDVRVRKCGWVRDWPLKGMGKISNEVPRHALYESGGKAGIGAGDWSQPLSSTPCRIHRGCLFANGPLNDWRMARPASAHSRYSGHGKSILRSFQLRSCRHKAITLIAPSRADIHVVSRCRVGFPRLPVSIC